VRQLFGKLGYQSGDTEVALSLTHADNALTGNGMQEFRMLAYDRSSVYTQPDQTHNLATQANLTARHAFSDELIFSGHAYARSLSTRTVNGDVNDRSLDQSIYQLSAADRTALQRAGYANYPTSPSGASVNNTPFPMWRCIAQALQADEPAEKCTGMLNRTHTAQSNHGFTGQWTWLAPLAGQRNQLTGGLAYDGNRTRFQQLGELGYINPNRSVTGVKAYGDGVTGGQVDGQPFDNQVDLRGQAVTWSLYASDTLSLDERWHLTLSGRYNHTHIRNSDQIKPGGGTGSLDGNPVFSRLNPALGLAFALNRDMTFYAGYNEGSRTPTSTELGCADPATPCKLPTPWPVTRRCARWSPEPGRRAGAAKCRPAPSGRRASFAPSVQTTFCLSHRTHKTGLVISATLAKPGARAWNSACKAARETGHGVATTPGFKRRTKALKHWGARPTAAATPVHRAWTAASLCAQAMRSP
jgi:outer membrane receptor for Fe3+-dicitrate